MPSAGPNLKTGQILANRRKFILKFPLAVSFFSFLSLWQLTVQSHLAVVDQVLPDIKQDRHPRFCRPQDSGISTLFSPLQ
ncbi:MAG: hypothetical protein IJ266_00615 [Elusimicrobiaceae bacterium]|nr:hypothetical protein [Elusimicrobiaceae bacterium]